MLIYSPSSMGSYSGTVNATYTGTKSDGCQVTLAVTISLNGAYAQSGFVNPQYVGPGPNRVQWNGYGSDVSDPTSPDMDVIGIPVGCLNGDFSSSAARTGTCQDISSGPLARAWAHWPRPHQHGFGWHPGCRSIFQLRLHFNVGCRFQHHG